MKYFVINILIIISILSLSSCGKSFYYVKNHLNGNLDIVDYKSVDSFKTDSTSKVFIRRLYINKSLTNLYGQITIDELNDNKLIEVQYLIFNGDKVLYISTIPSKYIYDKTQQYLLKKVGGKISYPNSFFFNSFYFGSVKSRDDKTIIIEFKNKKKVINWNLKIVVDAVRKYYTFKLISIEEFKLQNVNKVEKLHSIIKTDESVNNEISFNNTYEFIGNPKNYFKYLSFKVPYSKYEAKLVDRTETELDKKDSTLKDNKQNKKETFKQMTEFPTATEILIIYKDTTKSKVKKLIIPFENNFKSIKFKGNRVKFINSL